MNAPVLAIDGPSGSGKGAVGQELATRLGWHYLDSGAFYRALALRVLEEGTDPADARVVSGLAVTLDLSFVPVPGAAPRLLLGGRDISDDIRSEACSGAASEVAAHPGVRTALLAKQRAQRRPPGLVADGRDMGTTVFPDAVLKVFLTASAEVRAERRYKQLKEKGFSVTLPRLLGEIRARDVRDMERAASPLRPAPGAFALDSSTIDIDGVVGLILERLRNRLK
jgi:cytidylate kinase